MPRAPGATHRQLQYYVTSLLASVHCLYDLMEGSQVLPLSCEFSELPFPLGGTVSLERKELHKRQIENF